MVKAQSRFGGTSPKETGVGAKPAKENTGTQKPVSPRIVRKTKVKQVGVTSMKSGNNHQMVRDAKFQTKSVKGRPSLTGKEDNRTSWR